jgi:hypothetical protein
MEMPKDIDEENSIVYEAHGTVLAYAISISLRNRDGDHGKSLPPEVALEIQRSNHLLELTLNW